MNGTPLYPVGYKKAAYGTFMAALTTLWLSDELADEMASCLEITLGHGTPAEIMSVSLPVSCS